MTQGALFTIPHQSGASQSQSVSVSVSEARDDSDSARDCHSHSHYSCVGEVRAGSAAAQ